MLTLNDHSVSSTARIPEAIAVAAGKPGCPGSRIRMEACSTSACAGATKPSQAPTTSAVRSRADRCGLDRMAGIIAAVLMPPPPKGPRSHGNRLVSLVHNHAMCVLRRPRYPVACAIAVLITLAGCASLAVRPCDTIEDRDGKYFGRFFLGVATLGLSEVTIQQEEFRQADEGSPGCPPPPGVRVVSPSIPNAAGGQSVAVGTLVNGAPWAIVIYLNQDPDAPGAPPLTVLFPNGDIQLAFR